MLVGMIIPDQTNPFFAELSFQLQIQLAQVSVPLVVLSSDGDAQREHKCLQTLNDLKVSGIVFVSAGDDSRVLDVLKTINKPHIIIDRELPPGTENCDFVISDNRAGIKLAVDHLISKGHRSLAFIKGCQNTDPGRVRLLAFREWVRKGGLNENDLYEFDGSFDYLSGYEAAKKILVIPKERRPTAIVASNDLSAIGALQCLHENGLKVPADISLVGFDDIVMCRWIYPRLTTVRQDTIALTRSAAVFLLSRIFGEYEQAPRLSPVVPQLIERQSTRDLT
jgi:LacI family transcriptional regulator